MGEQSKAGRMCRSPTLLMMIEPFSPGNVLVLLSFLLANNPRIAEFMIPIRVSPCHLIVVPFVCTQNSNELGVVWTTFRKEEFDVGAKGRKYIGLFPLQFL